VDIPYSGLLNVAVIVVFILAFIKAETIKPRVILSSIMALIILLPQVASMPAASTLWFLHHIGKVLFGLACVIYIKWAGLAY
jgi:hypothetical protein